MNIAFIGIGSNLGNRLANCEAAISILSQDGLIKNIIKSRWYETAPLLFPDKCRTLIGEKGRKVSDTCIPHYINGAIKLSTSLSPADLLRLTQSIETKLGRVRTDKKWEPRTVDLDILFYDDLIIDTPSLKIPHPELHKRMFVLRPLCDIAPDLKHPAFDKTIKKLLEENI
ncbi:MAG: 2-amino-4-hydroxy-6-hydroxymethyldihydropteridine diphosphokinase [Deltaproteobacteria bacterium]|nr:2-amino-4-hydroxy-6-hydroxymethyldihydropteridine diphosphokinase [Deltaproteobacteria bacterium]